MQVRMELTGPGWMRLTLAHGPRSVELIASYLNDTPRELLDALLRVLNGEREARVVLVEEPGEAVMRLRVLPGELLRIETYAPTEDGPPPGDPGEPVFRHTELAERFAARVWGELGRLLREHGEDGFHRHWGLGGFPRQEYDTLEALLRARDVLPG